MNKPQNPLTALISAFHDLRKTSTFRFFGLAFLAYVVWNVAYEQVIKPRTTLDEVVIQHMVTSTETAFKAIGWPVGTYPQPVSHRDRVGLAGHAGVQIGVRVIVLARRQATSPEWLKFNHDYTFTVFIYGLVFALWYLWTVMGRQTPQASKA